MTVKTLNADQKQVIGQQFQAKMRNQKELAAVFGTSERTINRVLNELGILTAVPRLKGEAYEALQILKDFNLTASSLRAALYVATNVESKPTQREIELQTQLDRAVRALKAAGFEDLGGEEWRPPVVVPLVLASTEAQVVEMCMNLAEEDWGLLLSKIATARVAKASNTHTQTAMLKIQQAVERSAKG